MFYDKVINVYKETTSKNEIGQTIKSYEFLNKINCDIQPSTVSIIRETFGDDIESLFVVFCDNNIAIGTVVSFNNATYKVDKKVDWIDYKIYSLIGCDVNVNR